MRKIAFLLVVASMLLGVGGCSSSPADVSYRDVSVGPMSVSIPDDWERPNDYEDLEEEVYTAFAGLGEEAVQLDAFGDKSDEVGIVLVMIDMAAIAESSGVAWRGWDIELEAAYMTKGEYAELTQTILIGEFTELTRETHQQLTLQGYEAWESLYTGESEGEPVQICILVVFIVDEWGMLYLVAPQDEWSQYQETWTTIRDSVDIS